jgi:hypothetical protein
MVSVDDDEAFARLCGLVRVDPAAGSRSTVERAAFVRLREGVAADVAEQLTGAGVPAAAVCDDLATVPADDRFSALFEPVGDRGVAPRAPWEFR